MKKRIITFLLTLVTTGLFSQPPIQILTIPGQGIIVNNDTIKINIENPETLLEKLDTVNYISYGTGIACGITTIIDSETGEEKGGISTKIFMNVKYYTTTM